MEKDKIYEKEAALEGKEVTKAERIIMPGETVKEFIARNWNKN